MGGWGCPHEQRGRCARVDGRPCAPGMQGCVLHGRYVFSTEAHNRPGVLRRERRRADGARVDD